MTKEKMILPICVDNYESILDTMLNEESVSKAARFWNKRSLWQKILGGIAIPGATFILGFAVESIFLMKISGVIALVYPITGIFLDAVFDNDQIHMNKRIEIIAGYFAESTSGMIQSLKLSNKKPEDRNEQAERILVKIDLVREKYLGIEVQPDKEETHHSPAPYR